MVWGLANLNKSFKLGSGDEVRGYLLCACPHEQGKSNIFKFVATRVVCWNTFSLALGEATAEYRRSHRSEFTDVSIEQAKLALGIARDQMGEFEKTARLLVKKKMTLEMTLAVLTPIFAADTSKEDMKAKKYPPKLTAVLDAIDKAPGAAPGSAWGVFNGVTYYADHIASRTPDKRLSNAWFGRTAAQKKDALEALVAL